MNETAKRKTEEVTQPVMTNTVFMNDFLLIYKTLKSFMSINKSIRYKAFVKYDLLRGDTKYVSAASVKMHSSDFNPS